jgi:hypothetical protein
MNAAIGLEDGTILHGTGFGSECEVSGELVFTTQFTGYEDNDRSDKTISTARSWTAVWMRSHKQPMSRH